MNKRYNNSKHVIKGLKYGAIGDAWGFEHEFKPFKKIIKDNIFIPQNLIISDDTQMALAIAEALEYFDIEKITELKSIPEQTTRDDIEAIIVENAWIHIIKKFMFWAVSEDNYRAPGNTCMGSLAGMIENYINHTNDYYSSQQQYYNVLTQEEMPSYKEISEISISQEEVATLVSKFSIPSIGSGAAMRVLPVMSLPVEYRYLFAWIQAITTHNDGRAAFSAMTLVNAWENIEKKGYYEIKDSINFIHEALENPTNFIDKYITKNEFIIDTLIEALPESSGLTTLEDFILQIKDLDKHGLTIETALNNSQKWTPSFPQVWRNQQAGVNRVKYYDPANFVGAAGWDSISAIAISLRIVEEIYSKNNLEKQFMDNENIADVYALYSMRESIATSGDSDTLACIVGHTVGYVESLNNRSVNIIDSLLKRVEKKYLHKINILDSGYKPSVELLSTLSFEEKSIFKKHIF